MNRRSTEQMAWWENQVGNTYIQCFWSQEIVRKFEYHFETVVALERYWYSVWVMNGILYQLSKLHGGIIREVHSYFWHSNGGIFNAFRAKNAACNLSLINSWKAP